MTTTDIGQALGGIGGVEGGMIGSFLAFGGNGSRRGTCGARVSDDLVLAPDAPPA